jgi:hypothetical protein
LVVITAAVAASAVGLIPLAASGNAQVSPKGTTQPAPARIKLSTAGTNDGKLPVGKHVRAVGHLRPFVPGQRVTIWLTRGNHVVKKRSPVVKQKGNRSVGKFHLRSDKLVRPSRYQVFATHKPTVEQAKARAHSRKFHISYPDLDPGSRGSKVKLFERLLSHEGYYTPHGSHYGSRTGLAVLAYRKVNRMARKTNATPGVFKTLADRKGGFKLKYPGQGRHVEVDISRQVMTLADHGKPQYTFHVSTGAPATPTIRGHYNFYSKQPGYNSERMYYSVYFHGGYATHGYNPVPTYPASHGCVRNPIPFSRFIYDWIHLGESIYLYG